MLLGLTIRDIVLIDRLDLAFRAGAVRADRRDRGGEVDPAGCAGAGAWPVGPKPALCATGPSEAAVTAEFAVGRNHPAYALLREAGLDGESETIVLRRLLRRRRPQPRLCQ